MSSKEFCQREAQEIDGDGVILKIVEIAEDQKEINKKLDLIIAAFPGGDLDGHRRYHETVIAMMEERRRMYAAIKEKTLSALLWLLIIAVGSWLYNEFKDLIIHIKPG